MRAPDVVVAGAGVIGASCAYALSRLGLRVTVLDRARAPAGATASGASAGGVRAQGRSPAELPLAVAALHRWPTLEAELDADLGYRREGMTVCVDRPELIGPLTRRVDVERAAGVDARVVLGEDLHRLVPGLAANLVAGSYSPDDGHANPIRTTNAFARAAMRLGAQVRFESPLTGIRTERGRVVAALSGDEAIPCGAVLVAAGPWTGALTAQLGVRLALRTGCIQMVATGPMPHALDQVLAWVGEGISLKQQPSGGYLIGGGWPGTGDPQAYRATVRPESVGRSASVAARLFPPMAGAAVLRAWVGFESWGPEDTPLIGPVGAPEGLWVAAGFSGHGFAISPTVGELVATWIATAECPSALAPFDPIRYGDDWPTGVEPEAVREGDGTATRGGGR